MTLHDITRALGAGVIILIFSTGGLSAMPADQARHLLTRTGFGASPQEIEALRPVPYKDAVAALLTRATGEAHTPPLDWVNDLPPPHATLDEKARKKRRDATRLQGVELKAWWLEEMAETPSPLLEQMTLFWHNHFTSSLQKIRWAPLMYRQNRLFRRHALGNFRQLLHEVARDPAMVIYLDSSRNKKGNPNENFARELLELFTLGEGHYSEQDIKEAARAFTGWSVDRDSGDFRFRPRKHDWGKKTFLGQRGRFNGDHIIDIILTQPEVADFITRKLWRKFVSPQPEPQEVTAIATAFRDSDYEISVLMEKLLNTPSFRDPSSYGQLTKSPVDLLVGTLRTLEIPFENYERVAQASRRLGQDLFDPPNVKGWPGGDYWITSATLADRREMLDRLLQYGHIQAPYIPDAEQMTRLLLALPPVGALPPSSAPKERLGYLLMDPVYQVK